jgi:alpha-galactosidase
VGGDIEDRDLTGIHDFRPVEYTGTVTADGLVIKLPTAGGRAVPAPPGVARARGGAAPGSPQPGEFLLKRVSTEAPKPAPAPLRITEFKEVKWNGLAKTPPMGWNSWNLFRRQVNDKLIREIADAMVKSGMRDAGYLYVNIDDTWEGTRDEKGNIRVNEKFSDMKALADYVHGQGLKLGIYSSPGPKTCAGYEGSFGHEEQDARTYAAWGIDYLKYDWCSAQQVYESVSIPAAYAKMGAALLVTGRPIVYSLCQYGLQNVGAWGARVGGNLWRITGDIRDTWDSMSRIGFDHMVVPGAPLVEHSGPARYATAGHWDDPDMLEIGNGGMTETEYRTHMSLWCLQAAPLLAGNDVRSMKPEILQILTNREVIAIDQDALGKPATRVTRHGDLEVWSRPLAGGGYAVGLYNRGAETAKVVTRWSEHGIQGTWHVRDLWAHADRGAFAGEYAAEVPSHSVVLVKLTR